MNKKLFWGLFILFVLVMLPTGAEAANLAETVMKKLYRTFNYSREVLLIIGGFGIIGIAFMAVFGKLRWGWFASLALGIAIISISGSIIGYVTQERGEGYSYGFGNFDDTLVSGSKPIKYTGSVYNSSSGNVVGNVGSIVNDVVNGNNNNNNNNSNSGTDNSEGARELLEDDGPVNSAIGDLSKANEGAYQAIMQ